MAMLSAPRGNLRNPEKVDSVDGLEVWGKAED